MPIKPKQISQAWGVLNPQFYSQFGFTRHNGQDWLYGTNREVRAPYDGKAIRLLSQTGGGNVLGFISDNFYDFPDFKCTTSDGKEIFFPAGSYQVLMDFLHLDHFLVTQDQSVKCGELLAIADNTGTATTGGHTHIQPRRVTYVNGDLEFVDKNDANGSFDPTQFWGSVFAYDYLLMTQQKSLLQKVVDILIKLLHK